jgi:molecular chaperone GrpE
VTDDPTTGKRGPTEPADGTEAAEPTGEAAAAPRDDAQAGPPSGGSAASGDAGSPDAGSPGAGSTDAGVATAGAESTGSGAESGPGADDRAAADAEGDTETPEVDDALQAAADAVEVDLELLLSERAQYLDAYRRAQADFENYRKQAQKRQDDAVLRALGGFVERLLPVLDSCDAALAHGAHEVEPVLTALYGALGKEGLERIDPKGAAFDPTEAEAVMHEPGEGGEQVVAEVLRPGYRWRGQVLRPAMVKVTD